MKFKTEEIDSIVIKNTLCEHFNMSFTKSHLTINKRDLFGINGENNHYNFILNDNKIKYRVFGKISRSNEKEYLNLKFLKNKISEKIINLPYPIALIKSGIYSLLLLEYLDGFSNPFSPIHLLHLYPSRLMNIIKIGKNVLNKIYKIQKYFSIDYSPLSAKDYNGISNQPKLISFFKQLEDVQSISDEIKYKLENRVNNILNDKTFVRRGLIHGDLGLRNVLVKDSDISFIDWDCMQYKGASLFDPCYFVTILLMRVIQLYCPQSQVNEIDESLFSYIKFLEENMTIDRYKKFVSDGLWYEKCISLLDTLWWYERMDHGYIKSILKRRHSQLKYLAYLIKKSAMDE